MIFRGGGGGPDPLSPLWIRPWNVAAGVFLNIYNKDRERERETERERERDGERELHNEDVKYASRALRWDSWKNNTS